jgi:hypothetical protein
MIQEIEIEIDQKIEKALNYTKITGKARPGDKVILNTTAVRLGLGTGGYHFIIYNFSYKKMIPDSIGHIMKLRYTPFQIKCLAAEEEDSPYREKILNCDSLGGTPVIVGSLHSMLACAVASVKQAMGKNARIVYIMTDGACLPIFFSRTVKILKDYGLIDMTVTVGHAFGGDLEAVNIYSGLLTAKAAADADVIVVTMGPGIVGTGSKYGFSGVEQGQIVNAVSTLYGKPIVIPRISFKDTRNRHFGISHHTITVLSEIALAPAIVAIPEMELGKKQFVLKQLRLKDIHKKHRIIEKKGDAGIELLKQVGFDFNTMGRKLDDEPEFFKAACAAGEVASQTLRFAQSE